MSIEASTSCSKVFSITLHLVLLLQDTYDPMFRGGTINTHRSISHTTLTAPKTDTWETKPSELDLQERIGEGAFGEVYKGTLKYPSNKIRASSKNVTCMPVAIKLLKSMHGI